MITNEFQYWILHIKGNTITEKKRGILDNSVEYIKEFYPKYPNKVLNEDIFKLRCELSNVECIRGTEDTKYIGHTKHTRCTFKCFKSMKCSNIFIQKNNLEKGIKCRVCEPIITGYSLQEKEVLDFIKEVYKGKIIENDKSLGIELDIYLPEISLAIEYNGFVLAFSKI